MKTYINYLLVLVTLVLWSCEPNVDEFVPSAGSADFSVFVSVGDSYSAGYIDGALSHYGQITGFTNILATQLKCVGAKEFKQPMIPKGQSVGSTSDNIHFGNYKLEVVITPIDTIIMPVQTLGNPELIADPLNWVNGEGPFNNVAVPGAKSFHLLSPLFGDFNQDPGKFNPYYTRFASQPGVSTVVGDAMLNDPKFFSLWVGGNDVLWYALSGGTGNVGGREASDITSQLDFTNSIKLLVSTLTSTGAKGVICNIPGIDALPYFNHITYDKLELDANYAYVLNKLYANFPDITFKEGRNPFVVADASAPGGRRQMIEGEKVLLSASSGIQGEPHWGSVTPMPDSQFLTLDEIKNITDAVTGFNTIIKDIADVNGLAFVDANSIMDNLIDGIYVDGVGYNTEFVSGGMFSLDGIHASGRGYAIIANEFIKAINAKYNAIIPLVNVNDFVGVEFP